MQAILALKNRMTRDFDDKGRVVPLTELKLDFCLVSGVKTTDKDGYRAVVLGYGNNQKSKITKTQTNLKERLGGKVLPIFLREFRLDDNEEEPKVGQAIEAEKLFQAGDQVATSSISKGRGFASVIKRYNFKGGPRTHGQSDRERAPGSIGQTTTPGRVYKGKRMAGRLGGDRVTTRNQRVFKIDSEKQLIYITGAVPGRRNTLVEIYKH